MDPIAEKIIRETVRRTIENAGTGGVSDKVLVAEVMDVLEHSELIRGQVEAEAIRVVIDAELNRTGSWDEIMKAATIRREKKMREKLQ